MTLPLELGQVADPTARRALEQIALQWPDDGGNGGQSRGRVGYYSSASHAAGTTITITQLVHRLRIGRGLIVQVQDEATGMLEWPDVQVSTAGTVTVTFTAPVAANAKRVTVIG